MRQKDITPGTRYAYTGDDYNAGELAEVVVINPPKRGEVLVDILHPDPTLDDERTTVRCTHIVDYWSTSIAEEQAEIWKARREQHRLADALSTLGIKRARRSYLGRAGLPVSSPATDVSHFEPRELTKLLNLAAAGKAEPEAWAWLLADLTGPWAPGEPITIGGVYRTEAQAAQRVDDLAHEGTKLRTLRVIG